MDIASTSCILGKKAISKLLKKGIDMYAIAGEFRSSGDLSYYPGFEDYVDDGLFTETMHYVYRVLKLRVSMDFIWEFQGNNLSLTLLRKFFLGGKGMRKTFYIVILALVITTLAINSIALAFPYLQLSDSCIGISVSPNNEFLLGVTGSKIGVYRLESGELLSSVDVSLENYEPLIEWSPDGKKFAFMITDGMDLEKVGIYDAQNSLLLFQHSSKGFLGFTWCQDNSGLFINNRDGAFRYDLKRKKLFKFNINNQHIDYLRYMGSDKVIYSVGKQENSELYVTDIMGNVFSKYKQSWTEIAVSNNKKVIAYSLGNITARLFSADGDMKAEDINGVSCVDSFIHWSPDDSKVAFISTEGELSIFDLKTKKRKVLFKTGYLERASDSFFNEPTWIDNRSVAVVYSRTSLSGERSYLLTVNIVTGQKNMKPLPIERPIVTRWSNDGKYLFLSNLENTIYRVDTDI